MAGQIRVEWTGVTHRALVAPSLLSANPLSILASIEQLEGEEDWLHVDIMDGHFVPNLTYGPSLVKALSKALPNSFLDVHLMLSNPEGFIELFASAGANLITVHQEASVHLHRLLQMIRSFGCKVGVSINPGTCVEALYPILHLVDVVLVMSVNPGFGGQSFIPETLDKVVSLARWRAVHNAPFLIEIDGGISGENAAIVVKSGCDVLVAGNAIFGMPQPLEALRDIKQKIQKE